MIALFKHACNVISTWKSLFCLQYWKREIMMKCFTRGGILSTLKKNRQVLFVHVWLGKSIVWKRHVFVGLWFSWSFLHKMWETWWWFTWCEFMSSSFFFLYYVVFDKMSEEYLQQQKLCRHRSVLVRSGLTSWCSKTYFLWYIWKFQLIMHVFMM